MLLVEGKRRENLTSRLFVMKMAEILRLKTEESLGISSRDLRSPRTKNAVERPSESMEFLQMIVSEESSFSTGQPVNGEKMW